MVVSERKLQQQARVDLQQFSANCSSPWSAVGHHQAERDRYRGTIVLTVTTYSSSGGISSRRLHDN